MDGSYTFHGSARGHARSKLHSNGPLTADVTSDSTCSRAAQAQGSTPSTGGLATSRSAARLGGTRKNISAGVPVQSGGSFTMDGLTGQLYGPKTDVKTRPTRTDGGFDFMLHPQGGVVETARNRNLVVQRSSNDLSNRSRDHVARNIGALSTARPFQGRKTRRWSSRISTGRHDLALQYGMRMTRAIQVNDTCTASTKSWTRSD